MSFEEFHHEEETRSKQLATGEEPAIPEEVADPTSQESPDDFKKKMTKLSERQNRITVAELDDKKKDPPPDLDSPKISSIFEIAGRSPESTGLQAKKTELVGDNPQG